MNPAKMFASLTPVLMAAFAVVLANLPISFTGGIIPPPLLGLTVIYFWVLLRPDLVPPFAVLMVGLWEDFLSGGQPGLWTIGYLAAYGITDRQRDAFAGLAGWGVLLGFSIAMFTAATAVYVVGSAVHGGLAPVQPLLLQSLVTIILYPLMALILGVVHRAFIGAWRGDD
jgi:rod shape-determining protein MreD